MAKTILKTVLGALLGTVGGMLIMMGCHTATMVVYPAPEGLDIFDPEQQEAMHAWMQTLPAGAFVLAAFCHWIGTGAGAVIAMFITGRKSMLPAIIVGAVFLLTGIYNLTQIPHPVWFAFLDIPGYLLFGLLPGKLLAKKPTAA